MQIQTHTFMFAYRSKCPCKYLGYNSYKKCIENNNSGTQTHTHIFIFTYIYIYVNIFI